MSNVSGYQNLLISLLTVESYAHPMQRPRHVVTSSVSIGCIIIKASTMVLSMCLATLLIAINIGKSYERNHNSAWCNMTFNCKRTLYKPTEQHARATITRSLNFVQMLLVYWPCINVRRKMPGFWILEVSLQYSTFQTAF